MGSGAARAAFAPTFAESSEKHPDVVRAKVDTEAPNEGLQRPLGYPTIMAFKNGEVVVQPGLAAGSIGRPGAAAQGLRGGGAGEATTRTGEPNKLTGRQAPGVRGKSRRIYRSA